MKDMFGLSPTIFLPCFYGHPDTIGMGIGATAHGVSIWDGDLVMVMVIPTIRTGVTRITPIGETHTTTEDTDGMAGIAICGDIIVVFGTDIMVDSK